MAKKKETVIPSFIVPPVVTILGHVDHGKTTLLDTIRKTNVAGKESGGITQHIGAYQIKTQANGITRPITFIDTPGHEAFAKMRSRGASVADIAILVVAANDGLMPQTMESLLHIKKSKIPFIVAVTKIDLPEANIEKVKQQLTKAEVVLEEYGGEVPLVPISAKLGKGIDKLLEMIILLADLNEIKADPKGQFGGVVIEAGLDKSRGTVASIIVKNGTLNRGDLIATTDGIEAKVRAMFNEYNKEELVATPGQPVELLGLSKMPSVGTIIYKKNEKALEVRPTQALDAPSPLSITTPEAQEITLPILKIILKTDNIGSLEAILESLKGKETIELINASSGNITESDIMLAKSSNAIIIGFHTKPPSTVVKLAQSEKVMIKTYTIIYEMLDEIDEVAEALRTGGLEEVFGEGRVLASFDFDNEKVIGLKVLSGRIARGDKIKLVREEKEIGRARIKSLRHGKEDITKAEQGTEAGVILTPKLDFLVNDSIIAIG